VNTRWYDPGKGMEDHEDIPASQTDVVLGATGDQGDYIDHFDVQVTTAATSACSYKDGKNSAAIPIMPNNTPVGIYQIHVRRRARASNPGGWYVTTGAGVSVSASGVFT